MSEMQKRNLYHYKNSSSKRIHIKYFKLGKNTVQFLCACLWPWLGIKVIQNSINIFFFYFSYKHYIVLPTKHTTKDTCKKNINESSLKQ